MKNIQFFNYKMQFIKFVFLITTILLIASCSNKEEGIDPTSDTSILQNIYNNSGGKGDATIFTIEVFTILGINNLLEEDLLKYQNAIRKKVDFSNPATIEEVEKLIYTCTPFYLHENGVTIKAREGVAIGTESMLNNKTYTLVDRETLMKMIAEDSIPDLTEVVTSNILNMSQFFSGKRFFNQEISSWDTHNVTNMSSMFHGSNSFNQDIGLWDTGKVENMRSMFGSAYSFNQYIGDWNTSKVISMSSMFAGASHFNTDLNKWETGIVYNMQSMFAGANDFNQDIGSWDVSNVLSMHSMFWSAVNFNQDISSWDTSNVTTMKDMFDASHALFFGITPVTSFDQDISSWNVCKIKVELRQNEFFDRNTLSSWSSSEKPNFGKSNCSGN